MLHVLRSGLRKHGPEQRYGGASHDGGGFERQARAVRFSQDSRGKGQRQRIAPSKTIDVARAAFGDAGEFQEFDGFRLVEWLDRQAAEQTAPARRTKSRGQRRFAPAENHVRVLWKRGADAGLRSCRGLRRRFAAFRPAVRKLR